MERLKFEKKLMKLFALEKIVKAKNEHDEMFVEQSKTEMLNDLKKQISECRTKCQKLAMFHQIERKAA